jgi:hypothetical protein
MNRKRSSEVLWRLAFLGALFTLLPLDLRGLSNQRVLIDGPPDAANEVLPRHTHRWETDVILGLHGAQVVIGTGSETLQHVFVVRTQPGVNPPTLPDTLLTKAIVQYWHGGILVTGRGGESYEFSRSN